MHYVLRVYIRSRHSYCETTKRADKRYRYDNYETSIPMIISVLSLFSIKVEKSLEDSRKRFYTDNIKNNATNAVFSRSFWISLKRFCTQTTLFNSGILE